jgi:hypothetical protein
VPARATATPEEQHKRFKEAAKEAGVTKSEEEFERTFKKIISKLKKTPGRSDRR